MFYEKVLQKINQTEFRIEKATIINLIVGLIKKILLYKVSYFSEPTHSKNKIKNDLNLFSYATKSDLKTEQVF